MKYLCLLGVLMGYRLRSLIALNEPEVVKAGGETSIEGLTLSGEFRDDGADEDGSG